MKAKINDISVTPVKKYSAPKYPTRTDAGRTPMLLRKLPSRWEKNAAVIAAVGMLGAMSLTSCGVTKTDVAGQGQEQETTICEEICEETGYLAGDVIMEIPSEQESEDYFVLEGNLAVTGFTTEQEVTDTVDEIETQETTIERNFLDTSYIMPAAGGVGPIQYLSETDALTIIKVMAATNGLKLEELPPNVEDVPQYFSETIKKLYDAEKQVGVEYSSSLGYYGENPYISSEGIAVGSFRTYGYWDEANVENETDMQTYLEEDLREQVRDFIEWLQGQGII